VKVALLTDTHFGIKNDDKNLLASQVRFMNEIFWPEIDRLGVLEIVHLGDLFDRRKYVNFLTAKACRDSFISEIKKRNQSRGLVAHQIIGNHDDYYRNTNEYNSPMTIFKDADGVVFHHEPSIVEIGGARTAIVPWICEQTLEATSKILSDESARVCMGHLEMVGFDMHRGQPSEHGMDPDSLGRFDRVFSGHFHTRSTRGNITYLGSTGQYTWADYDDPKGFHIFDTETNELEFIENPIRDFEKVFLSADNLKVTSVPSASFVKMVVNGNLDKSVIDDAVIMIESTGVHDLQVVQDTYDDPEIVKTVSDIDGKDTLSLLETVIDKSECSDKELAKELVRKLYAQSQEMM
jgi:DNA repair exonuclease SbcCD nuclease subunit